MSSRKTIVSFKLVLGILFVLLVCGIAILGVVSYQNNKNALGTAYALQKTHHVLDQADEISSLLKDIQLESNAFYIRRDSAVILPYLKSRSEVSIRTDELRHSIRGSTRQESNVDSLQSLLNDMVEFADEGLNFKQERSINDLHERIVMSSHFRERIRGTIGAIKREEQQQMVQRQRDYEASIDAFRMTYILLLSGIGLLLVATFFSIRYNFNKRIKAQEEQKKARELFEKIFYESPMGIVISRLDSGEIIDCNRSYTELVKYEKSEIIGKSAVQLGIVGASGRSQITEVVRDNGVARDVELQLTPKNSDQIWVSKSMQTIVIDNEVCLLSAVLDMTQHKEAEEKMKQALASEIELNKLKSDFVTLASHEFRTPLTTAFSSATLAEKYASGENAPKISKHLSRIKASINLLVSILDEFLSLTKIEEKKIEPKIEEINIRETIEAQCGNLRMFKKPGQEIVYSHVGAELFHTDPVLLKSILNNLVSNAIKYSDDNSQILVSSSIDTEVKLAVRDFGIGISAEDQTHLFERFFRASNTGTVQGTGLGLHILKHYVDILHGSINVKSELGKGSEFEVTFHQLEPLQSGEYLHLQQHNY